MKHSPFAESADKRKRIIAFIVGICWIPMTIFLSVIPDSIIFSDHRLSWIVFGLPLFFYGSNVKNHLFRRGLFLSLSVVALTLFVSLFFEEKVLEKLSLYLGLSAIAAMIFSTRALIDIIKRTLYRDQFVHKRDAVVIIAYFTGSILAFTFLFLGLQLQNEQFLQISNPTYLFVDILYFNVVTFTTLGYGDIIPITVMAKVLVAMENFLAYIFVAIGFGLIVNGITRPAENRM